MGHQGQPVPTEVKRKIVLAKEYFDRCLESCGEEEHTLSVQRTADALDVGLATVRRVMAEYNRNPLFEYQDTKRGRPPRLIPESCQTVVREYIRGANLSGHHVTLESLCGFLEEHDPSWQFNTRKMGRTLDRWGFTFGKGTRTQHLKEREYVVAARRRYLRRKRANRKGDGTIRPEVYLDESYVNKNHSNDFVWYFDDDGPWIQKPTGKGERLIILNAISQDGWIPKAKLVFKSSRKTGDYHGQMNHDLFCRWLEERLLPNIPKKSLIIMDNAAYHNTLSKSSAPTSTSSKEKIKAWLESQNEVIDSSMLKAELIEILERKAPKPTFAVDELVATYGHEVIRTPQYHPELQPIETCWGIVKNQVARNCDFTMKNLIVQLENAFEKVTAKTCRGLIKKIREQEDKFWEEDARYDELEMNQALVLKDQ